MSEELLKLVTIVIIVTVIMVTSNLGSCFASEARLPPMQKKNMNDVTDLFPREVKDKAQVDAMINRSISNSQDSIVSKSVLSVLPGSDRFESTSSELGGLSQAEVDSKGYVIKAEQGELWNRAHVNHDDPMIKRHKQDTDRIAEGSKNFVVRLMDLLKEKLNVDCKQTKGPEDREPQMFIQVEPITEKEIVYDRFYCEHLMNTYNCFDELSLQCLQFAERPVGFAITSSSIPSKKVTVHGSYTSYEFSNRAAAAAAVRAGGGRGGFLGLVKKDSTTTLNASTVNVSFSFNVSTPAETVGRLEVVNLQFTSVFALKINGNIVIVAPGGGYMLELNGHHEEVEKGDRKYGGVFGSKVKHRTLYPKVATGTGEYILGKINPHNSYGTVNLLPFLRDGSNTIEIKVIGLDQALVSFVLNISERICLNWRENWNETCTLRVTQP